MSKEIAGQLKAFITYLREEEKSPKTIEKYERDVLAFLHYIKDEEICKERTIAYKHSLEEQGYAIRSINSMVTSVNRFLDFLGRADCKVKNLRCQRRIYCSEEKELTKISGTVEAIVYKNPSNGYVILELDSNNTLITVVGEIGNVDEGEELYLEGEYVNNPKYGVQFKALV